MDIGGALANARSQAGLTITDVSKRTRIRETIIRDIERDDYSACGGDFYARGHIRAIARVVGADPVALIAEYDAARMPPEPDLAGQNGAGDRHSANGSGPATGPITLSGITAAEIFRPYLPVDIRGGRRRRRRAGSLALVLLAVIGTLTYLLASGSSPGPSAAQSRPHHPGTAAHHPARPSVRPSASPSAAPAIVPLVPASAAAFGPGGTSQGDNPGLAGFAIDASDATAWQTFWYATPYFNGQQSGTGLLLDMGRPVTISSAQILLGSIAGATLQLRVGNTPVLSSLVPVAQATDAGGALTLPITNPISARYLLIWFTQLPSDNFGSFQAFIYNVRLTGTA